MHIVGAEQRLFWCYNGVMCLGGVFSAGSPHE